jgi:hypothetical protein
MRAYNDAVAEHTCGYLLKCLLTIVDTGTLVLEKADDTGLNLLQWTPHVCRRKTQALHDAQLHPSHISDTDI